MLGGTLLRVFKTHDCVAKRNPRSLEKNTPYIAENSAAN